MSIINSDKLKLKKFLTNKDFKITNYRKDNDIIILTEILSNNSNNPPPNKFKLQLKNVLSGGSGDNVFIVLDCNERKLVLKIFRNESSLNEITKHIDFSHLFLKEFTQSENYYLPCPLIYRHGLLSGIKPFSKKSKINEQYYVLMENIEGDDLHTYFNTSDCLNNILYDEMYDIIMQLFFLISRMKVNEQGIYMSHCDLHTKNIYICDLPKETEAETKTEITLDFNHIGIDRQYKIKKKIVKILDLGESFEYRKTDDGKKYKTCRLNRSMTKKLVHTFSKCYDEKYKIENSNSYGKQFIKKTKKISKKSGKYLKALSQRLRAGQNKAYGDEDLRFFVSILELFMFQYEGIKSDIKHIEKLSKLVSLVDNFYQKPNTKKQFEKIENKKYVINYNLSIDNSPIENIKSILGGIYQILMTFKDHI